VARSIVTAWVITMPMAGLMAALAFWFAGFWLK
jgi:phosphate/sulfate permease